MQYTEFEEKANYVKGLMKSCEVYLNKDLYDYKKITIDIENSFSDFNDEINAIAKVDKNGHYSVMIYNGVYVYIDDFFKEMLKDKDFYYIVSGGKKYSENGHGIYFNIMKEITMKTVIYHELGHIFNGHLDFIKQAKNTQELSLYAFSNEDRSFLDPMVWQSIEWNADDFAASRIIGQFTFKDFIDKLYICDERHGLILTTTAILVVFALKEMVEKRTSKVQEKFDKYKELEHLPKRFRVEQYIKAAVHAYQNMNSVKLPEEIKTELINMSDNIEMFISKYEKEYLGIKRETSENTDEMDEEHRDYYEQVEGKYLCEIAFSLEKHAYFQVIDQETKNEVLKVYRSLNLLID